MGGEVVRLNPRSLAHLPASRITAAAVLAQPRDLRRKVVGLDTRNAAFAVVLLHELMMP